MRNLHLGEAAEAGVDAVGRRLAIREFVDDSARRAHLRARGLGQGDRREVVGDRHELVEREGVAVEVDYRPGHRDDSTTKFTKMTKTTKSFPAFDRGLLAGRTCDARTAHTG